MRLRHSLRKASLVLGLLGLACLGLLRFKAGAGNPHSATYSADNTRVLWFIHTSDTHIGARGSTDSVNLTWLLGTARQAIEPSFVVVSGDLTDSTNGSFLGIPSGPYQKEWDEYRSIITAAIPAGTSNVFFDLPGNHDGYNDANFAYYLNNSIQGKAGGRTQLSWTRTIGAEKYHFLGINSCDNTGAPFSIFWPYGDNAGLDDAELAFVQASLAENSDAALTLVFGHHPIMDTGASDDTWLNYGYVAFVQALGNYGASLYGYGHTHDSSEKVFDGDSRTGDMPGDGLWYLNLASLGKSTSNQYSVIAIDCNGISTAVQTIKTWPVVLITAPVGSRIGTSANPYAYPVPAAAANPLRALVFDTGTVTQVRYRVDGSSTWLPMTRVTDNPKLWEAVWNASGLGVGSHTVEVQATGTSVRSDSITVNVTAPANRAPVAGNDAYTVIQGSSLSVQAPGVMGNDSDPDGDALTAELNAPPGHGLVTLDPAGSFVYTPDPAFSGTDSFTYTASDGQLAAAAVVSITVTASSGPDSVTITKATYRTKTKQMTVEAKSTAAPQAVLTVWAEGTTAVGTMTYNATSGLYTFTKKISPAPSTVKVTSDRGGEATAGVNVVK